MKRITYLLVVFAVVFSSQMNAQEDAKRECQIKYNLFKGDFDSKKYDDAYTNWIYLMDNCPDLSINIYKRGAKLAEDVRKDPALAKRVYEQRLKYFPEQDDKINNLAKVHSDYAEYLINNNLATDDEVFALLDKAYEADPKNMSIKNIYRYFEAITKRFKDTEPQRVFDTYDDVMENVSEKLDNYAAKIAEYRKDSANLSSAKLKNLNAYKINSKAIGSIEGGLDNIISEIATCERLVPLYTRDFESFKNDSVWLRRAVSRMFDKGCQDEPLYEELAKAYAEAAPSASAYSFYAGILEKNGDSQGAAEMKQKAFDLETDPNKKAKLKLQFAQAARKRGQLSKARSLAREALQFNPNFGKAHLFIGTLYQSSVNDCGSNEFEKRMVYAAALRQARRAVNVDPSIGSLAGKYIRTYIANLPSKKVIFTEGVQEGASYTIKCWINETVKIQTSGK